MSTTAFCQEDALRAQPGALRPRLTMPWRVATLGIERATCMVHANCFNCGRSLDQDDELRQLTGVCEQCFNEILSSPEKRSAYLESLGIPAALVSREQVVLDSNAHFLRMASGREVVGTRIGEILDCMYAPLLGQCGDTVPCLLCKVRRSLEHTWLTGEGLHEVPFSFPHKVEERRTFAITTEKAGDAVLLLLGTTPSEE